MSLIDTTYFINDISVPANKLNSYQQYIDVYEYEVLNKLLGYNLNKALIADLDNGTPQSQRFTDLIQGAEYSFIFNGVTLNYKWDGLVNTLKKSLISYYVYFKQKNIEQSLNSNIGQIINNVENSQRIDDTFNLIYIWNRFIELYGYTPSYYFNLNYESVFYDNSNYIHMNNYNSAYNFLLSNINDYPEWVFTPIRNQNIFGI